VTLLRPFECSRRHVVVAFVVGLRGLSAAHGSLSATDPRHLHVHTYVRIRMRPIFASTRCFSLGKHRPPGEKLFPDNFSTSGTTDPHVDTYVRVCQCRSRWILGLLLSIEYPSRLLEPRHQIKRQHRTGTPDSRDSSIAARLVRARNVATIVTNRDESANDELKIRRTRLMPPLWHHVVSSSERQFSRARARARARSQSGPDRSRIKSPRPSVE